MWGSCGPTEGEKQVEAGVYKTKAQLKSALPNDVEKLKELTSQLLVKNTALQKELELAKQQRAASQINCHPNRKPK